MAVNKVELLVHEVINKVAKQKSKKDKISVLKQNESWALKDILGGTYDASIEWNLPQGPVPFRASDPHNAPTNLLRQNQQFRYFFKGGPGDKLNTMKRESLFIGLLEGIHPEDANLVVDMINKKKINGIPKDLVKEAFPSLLRA